MADYGSKISDSSSRAILTAVEGLYASSTIVRAESVERLVTIGEPAIPALVDVLTIANGWTMQARHYLRGEKNVTAQERDAWAREAAVSALQRIGGSGIQALMRALDHHSLQVCTSAAAAMRLVQSPEAADKLLQVLHKEIAVAESERRKRRRRLAGRVATMALVAAAAYWLLAPDGSFKAGPILIFAAMFLFSGRLFLEDARARLRQNLVQAFSANMDMRSVGPLALCLYDTDKQVRQSAEYALKKLLPNVTPEDRHTIMPSEMAALIRTLRHRDEQLVLAVLRAFEHVGDERCLSDVRDLATFGKRPWCALAPGSVCRTWRCGPARQSKPGRCSALPTRPRHPRRRHYCGRLREPAKANRKTSS